MGYQITNTPEADVSLLNLLILDVIDCCAGSNTGLLFSRQSKNHTSEASSTFVYSCHFISHLLVTKFDLM